MIHHPDYEDLIRKVYEHHQEHMFEYWGELNDAEKRHLLDDLSEIDFGLIERLYSLQEGVPDTDFAPAPYIPIPVSQKEKDELRRAQDAGMEHIREGRVAAFVVAGGQGSRLGFEGPKGMFPIGPVSDKTLFQIHAEKIVKTSRKYNTAIPFLIMTSRANHEDTTRYFREHKFFGLPSGDVYIFPQNMIPSLDEEGRLILATRSSVFKNPDGHGGSLTALETSGVLAEMKKRGVETISYFQVDNPLVRVIDPVFIGFHAAARAEVSSKAVKKASPEEKVGVFVRFGGGKIGVIEYSDLPPDKAGERDEGGRLRYSSGNIAIHLFDRDFVGRVASETGISLPYHRAQKKIEALRGGAMREIEGIKFEKFVFDALPLAEKSLVLEVAREDEFAPVKNASGADSVESARKLMADQHRKWLTRRGIRIPERTRVIEISPLAAIEPEDINADLVVPDKERVYIS
jgi:UDP-N-acetylglucosamine/UDP-N-acetylgalactosamine diphosphorylase